MKGCKALQIIFGIICVLFTIAVGSLMVLLLLPYLGGDLTNGPLFQLYDGVRNVATTVGLAGLEWVVICVVFALPTLLLLIATNLLLYGKRGGSIKAGVALADVAVVISCGVMGWFSAEMFGDLHTIGFYTMLGCMGLFVLLTIITGAVLNNLKKKALANVAPTNDTTADEQVVVTVEEDGDQVVEATGEVVVDQTVDTETATETTTDQTADQVVADTATDQQSDDGILFMAQDYSSVSEASDETYEHNEVLTKKVLAKLKLARELYEKGAITKDEYLALVNKYLVQE